MKNQKETRGRPSKPVPDENSLGIVVEDQCRFLGLTSRALAERSGLHVNTLARLLSGKKNMMKNCTVMTFIGLAKGLDLELDELVELVRQQDEGEYEPHHEPVLEVV